MMTGRCDVSVNTGSLLGELRSCNRMLGRPRMSTQSPLLTGRHRGSFDLTDRPFQIRFFLYKYYKLLLDTSKGRQALLPLLHPRYIDRLDTQCCECHQVY